MTSEKEKIAITAVGNNFSPVYKETALKAVDEMPLNGSHKD
jgi:hypothetical protein